MNPSTVIVAFPGRVTSGTINDVDIFIAYSLDGGNSFGPSSDPYLQIFHITNQSLDLGCFPSYSRELQEFMPSVALDPFGGVHLLYAECPAPESLDDPTPIAVGYAYWRSVADLSGAPYQKEVLLAPSVDSFAGQGGNEYQMIVSDGYCLVHAAYSGGGTVGYRRITLEGTCAVPADSDTDGQLTLNDVALFLSRYGCGDPQADLNLDLAVNTADVATFFQSYQCACRP
jgi:hypothetical protein